MLSHFEEATWCKVYPSGPLMIYYTIYSLEMTSSKFHSSSPFPI